MQEFYCHRTVDAARTDFLELALAGYVAIFERLSVLGAEDFTL
jgi:hypothetical protein